MTTRMSDPCRPVGSALTDGGQEGVDDLAPPDQRHPLPAHLAPPGLLVTGPEPDLVAGLHPRLERLPLPVAVAERDPVEEVLGLPVGDRRLPPQVFVAHGLTPGPRRPAYGCTATTRNPMWSYRRPGSNRSRPA